MLNKRSITDILTSKKAIYSFLIIYGFITAYFLCLPHYRASDLGVVTEDVIYNFYMSSRYDWINETYQQIINGEYLSALTQRQNFSASFILYYAVVPAIFGLEVWQGLWYTQFAFMIIGIAIYPVLVYRFFGNKNLIIALITPFALKQMTTWGFIAYANESYWMFGWIVLVSVPIFLNLCRDKWSNKSYIWVGILIFLMGIANMFRGQGALGVLLLLIIVCAFKIFFDMRAKTRKMLMKKAATFLIIIVVSFFGMNLFSKTVPEFIGAVSGKYGDFQYTEPWHTLYIGISDFENRYGITYSDFTALNKALEIDPDVVYESPEYYEILKNEYFSVIEDDPFYFIYTYLYKLYYGLYFFTFAFFSIGVGNGFVNPYLLCLLTIVLPFVILFLARVSLKSYLEKYWFVYAILFLTVAFSIIQPLVSIFRMEYNVGLVASFATAVLFMLILPLKVIFDKIYSILIKNDKLKKFAIIFK